jgi:hypothetical protein
MFPPDILLPNDAKYLIIGDFDKNYNAHWDITWSISYALTGSEHAFCTYLTESIPVSSVPGHYLGYTNAYGTPNGFLAIAFDTTGYFAVSSTYASGISPDNRKINSLIIRNGENLIYNEQLSSINPSFNFTELNKTFKTLRFRVANGLTKLYVDYKTTGDYVNLIQIPLSGYNINNIGTIHPILSYTAPVSSSVSPDSTIFLKNFNIQGYDSPPTYEICDFVPLSTHDLTAFNYLNIRKR